MEWKYVTKTNCFDAMNNGVMKIFIDSVIGAGLDIRTRKISGFTVLSFAADYGDLSTVEYLVQKGADYNAKNGDGSTPLHMAVTNNHRDVVEFLVNLEGVCVDCRDNKNRTPLHCVCETNYCFEWIGGYLKKSAICSSSLRHKEISALLLAKGASPNASDSKGHVPLLLAAKNKCVHVIDTLIMWGADIEYCNEQKWTLLHYASNHGWLDIAQSLVERVYNVNAQTCAGDTPIALSILQSRRDIFNLLVKSGGDLDCQNHGSKMTLLHLACQTGWLDVAQLLVQRGLDINAANSTGDTPVLLAAAKYRKEIVEMLFKCGAQLKCCNSRKENILHLACRAGWLDVVQSLIADSGFDINCRTSNHDTPLYIAASYSQVPVFDYLLDAQADANIKILATPSCDEDKAWTLLEFACNYGWLDAVVSLTKKGINVNKKSYDDDTPLHLSIKGGYLEITKHLLENGADCNIKGAYCDTGLACLISEDQANAETVKLFIEHGSYISDCDYSELSIYSSFQRNTLQDAELCTQAIINRFNVELEDLYEEPFILENLPPIERMKLNINTNVAICIEESVRHEVETNGYCNIIEIRPIALTLLSVNALKDCI